MILIGITQIKRLSLYASERRLVSTKKSISYLSLAACYLCVY